jgi:aminopeptidase N
LNEGFATYYAHLYTAHKNGREELLYDLYNNARGILPRLAENPRPIMDRKYDSPDAMFGFLAYDKGSWVLHMLRSQLGEEMYRRCVQTYLERQGLNNVVTEDLNRVIEELSGKSFDQFFDQWVYHGGAPELEVSYAWDARTKLARISVRQNQKLSDDVALFNLPLPVRFKTKAGVIDKTITVKEKAEDFYFALPEAPIGVRVDPELTLLARIRFDVAAKQSLRLLAHACGSVLHQSLPRGGVQLTRRDLLRLHRLQ